MAIALVESQSGVVDPPLVEIDVPSVGAGHPDHLWHGFGQSPELAFALAQRIFRLFAFGNILKCALHAQDGAFTVREYKAYEGRNPKTGEKITVPPKRLPFWKTGMELKQRATSLVLTIIFAGRAAFFDHRNSRARRQFPAQRL